VATVITIEIFFSFIVKFMQNIKLQYGCSPYFKSATRCYRVCWNGINSK